MRIRTYFNSFKASTRATALALATFLALATPSTARADSSCRTPEFRRADYLLRKDLARIQREKNNLRAHLHELAPTHHDVDGLNFFSELSFTALSTLLGAVADPLLLGPIANFSPLLLTTGYSAATIATATKDHTTHPVADLEKRADAIPLAKAAALDLAASPSRTASAIQHDLNSFRSAHQRIASLAESRKDEIHLGAWDPFAASSKALIELTQTTAQEHLRVTEANEAYDIAALIGIHAVCEAPGDTFRADSNKASSGRANPIESGRRIKALLTRSEAPPARSEINPRAHAERVIRAASGN